MKYIKRHVLALTITIFLIIIYVLFPVRANNPLLFTQKSGKNDFFRAITTQFIHLNMIHLIVNLIFFAIAINQLQKYFSRLKIIIFCFLSLLIIALMLCLFAQSSESYLGISGVVLALFGLILMCPVANEKERATRISDFVGMIIFTLASSDVSWIAHFSGLGFGVLAGLIEKQLRNHKERLQ
ncbi:rhomboid family intramembrane serine protease [Lactococcus cremoris]|uniref:rhomboid family intramembrane serine protease n=1 Tax=Lactococcus lactis subsp. cremoris TaxID=1359 RepID=UPI0003AB5ACD|nr:rhomboid family intramembrane serine protease [Lactococcus cremoris]AGV72777.1 rhomboid family protein [Lactococcus cremoris subsp. cremoris KW2]